MEETAPSETVSQQTEGSTQSSAPEFSVPEAYQDKGWAGKIKSVDDLWKDADSANSLIGKKQFEPPAADATEEEWTAFYDKLRPETPDKYEFGDVDGLPEGADLTEQKALAQDIMHKAGLTTKQANDVWQMYMKAEIDALGKQTDAAKEQQVELDKQFDELRDKLFGEEYDAKAEMAKGLFNELAPEELQPALSEMGDKPKLMAAMIHVLSSAQEQINAVKKEYGAEDDLSGKGDQVASNDIMEVRNELAKLRVSPEAKDFTNREVYEKTQARIQVLQEKVKRHYNK